MCVQWNGSRHKAGNWGSLTKDYAQKHSTSRVVRCEWNSDFLRTWTSEFLKALETDRERAGGGLAGMKNAAAVRSANMEYMTS